MDNLDNNEVKIKEAARKLFQEKGFGAVRTREIAEAAGINSALLHYYYRSKEKLFRIIMTESISELFSTMWQAVFDVSTSLSEKIDTVVNGYIDVIQDNPNLALFVFNELHSNPSQLIREAKIPQNLIHESCFYRQLEEQLTKKMLPYSALHIIINAISLSVMPGIAAPMICHLWGRDKEGIEAFLEERRRLIPLWMRGMLHIEE